jgi:hypothetical protein
MSPPPYARSGNASVPDNPAMTEMMREMARIRAQSDRVNSRVDHMSQNGGGGGKPSNKGGGNGGNKGGGNGGNKNQQNNDKRPRGGNDKYERRDNHNDHRRVDDDGRNVVRVRTGPNHRTDSNKGRNNR